MIHCNPRPALTTTVAALSLLLCSGIAHGQEGGAGADDERAEAPADVGPDSPLAETAQGGPWSEPVWHLGVEAITDFPIFLGVGVNAETPSRIRMSLSLGWLPPAYLSAATWFLVAIGYYDEVTANLIEAAIKDSFILRAHVGWRRFAEGWYADLGYTLIGGGGGLSEAELIYAVTGYTLPSDEADTEPFVELGGWVHCLDFEIGHVWVLANDMTLRAALGVTFSVAANAHVSLRDAEEYPILGPIIEGAAESLLSRSLRNAFVTPLFTFAVGYRIF